MAVLVASERPFTAGGGGQVGPGAAGPRGYYGFNSGQAFSPAVNLYETETCYVVCVDLSGVEKAKIDIELDGLVLKIRGVRAVPTDFDPESVGASGKRCRVHVMEIDHGPFARSVELPANANRDAIVARHREGLLWIEAPKQGQ
jgi:HSP20 family protein